MLQKRICKQCEQNFIGGPRAYYCPECRLERRKVQTKEHRERKAKGHARSLGSIDTCNRCGGKYLVNGPLQRFCPDCQKPHNLEYDRENGLKYYHDNKEDMNPTRYERRQIGSRECEWCGNEYKTNTRQLTCSQECKRKRKNALWSQNDRKKKAIK